MEILLRDIICWAGILDIEFNVIPVQNVLDLEIIVL